MKKILFTSILIIILLTLSACSLQDYIPTTNDIPVIVLNDSFKLNISGENTSSNIKNISQDNNTVIENNSEEEDFDANNYLTTIKIVEGQTVSLKSLTAQDPDGDMITYTYSQPFDETGIWKTKDGDAGEYVATITASDGVLSTSETVLIRVLPSNKAPEINCPSKITVKEGDAVNLDCSIIDKEGDNVTYKISGFMDSLIYQTDFNDAGTHDVIITASDGHKTSIKLVKVIIENVNRPPTFETIEPIEVTEGDTINLDLKVSDPDNDTLSIKYPFVFDENGVWKTRQGDAGNYDLEIELSDGFSTVKIPVNVIIKKINLAPSIENFEDITVTEGDTIKLNPVIKDDDGDSLSIRFIGFMNSSEYTTSYEDAGVYNETLIVSDGQHEVSKTITIEVLNKNRPPVFVVN